MVKLGSAIKNQVAKGQEENDIIKRNADYSLNAFITKDNKKNMRQASAKIKYAKDSLLDKIISSNLNENAINKRLEQISYSAINGQRQTEGTYKPEGVQMLGQLGREKPLESITKEMIQQYQEDEQAKPYMVDGETRQYRGATYEPQFPVSFGELRNTDVLDDAIKEYQVRRFDISSKMVSVDSEIKKTTDQIAAIKDEINKKGSTISIPGFGKGNLEKLRDKLADLEKLKQERKELEKSIDRINNYIESDQKSIEEIKRSNLLLNKQNREEVLKYEQSLKDANKNRLNLQQQPYESEYDYYQRLKEVEKEKFDPVLYKKYAENEVTKKLKPNLDELFSDTSFKENVIKNINAEDKFMINRLFDKVGKAFLDEYGYNNTRLSPKMTAESLKRILNTVKGQEISPLQAAIQRNKQREIYSDTIALTRDRQDLEARQAIAESAEARRVAIAEAADARRIAAATQRQNQRVEQSLNAARERRQRYAEQQVAADAAEVAAEGRQEAIARQQEIYNRQSQRETQYNARQAAEQQRQRSEQSLNAARERRQRYAEQQRQRSEQSLNAARERRQLYAEQQAAADAESTLRKERRKTERQLLNQALAEGQQQNKEAEAARNIQRIFRGNEGKIKAALVRNQNRIKARNAAADAAEATRIQQAKELLRQMESQARSDLTATRQPRGSYRFVDETPIRSLSQQEQEAIERTRANEELLKFQTAERDRNRQNKQATLIKSVLRGHKGRKQYEQDKIDRLVQLSMEAQQRGQMQEPTYISTSPELSPTTQSMISAATTVAAEQILAGLRKPRSDLGSTKAPYVTKKKMEKELQKKLDSEFYETLTPDELNYFNSKKRLGGKTVTTILNEIRKQREGPKGSGLKYQFRKPAKRQVKINPEEKKKNRLQLVVSQIHAGNTNPKLILEVNKLYKSLYDIDNAYMMLK
jgi:hypothetical protein